MKSQVVDTRDRVYIARQPILDAHGRVWAYELLYRGSGTDTACREASPRAAARVLDDALLSVGLDTLTGGRRAFINFTQEMLLRDLASLLPPGQVVVEVLEGEVLTDQAVEACRALRERGYLIALDDFTPGSGYDVLLPYASFVKVDVLATSPGERRAIHEALPPGITRLAEKVESVEVFEETRDGGYTLFQGYYFCRPATVSTEALSSRHLAYTRLLSALSSPHVSVAAVEDLIKHDASLWYRVLRCINSAAFGVRREITSIRQALLMLGLDRIRKWAAVWAMAGLSSGANPELVTTAVLRARSCELLGEGLSGVGEGSELFLLGLCSLMDTMIGRSMAQIVAELPLPDGVRAALTGTRNAARLVLDTVIAYERGDWDEAEAAAAAAGLEPGRLQEAYADALTWARELTTVMAA